MDQKDISSVSSTEYNKTYLVYGSLYWRPIHVYQGLFALIESAFSHTAYPDIEGNWKLVTETPWINPQICRN